MKKLMVVVCGLLFAEDPRHNRTGCPGFSVALVEVEVVVVEEKVEGENLKTSSNRGE